MPTHEALDTDTRQDNNISEFLGEAINRMLDSYNVSVGTVRVRTRLIEEIVRTVRMYDASEVSRTSGTRLRELAGEPEILIDPNMDGQKITAITAMHLLERAADWLDADASPSPVDTPMPTHDIPREGALLDPHGKVIGTVDGPSRTHDCEPGCRLHDPCCDTYVDTGRNHDEGCGIAPFVAEANRLRTLADKARQLNRPMVARLRQCAADASPNYTGAVTVYPPEALQLIALIDFLLDEEVWT